MNVTGGGGLLERERIEQLELQVKELHVRVRALEQRSDRRLCPPQRDKPDAALLDAGLGGHIARQLHRRALA